MQNYNSHSSTWVLMCVFLLLVVILLAYFLQVCRTSCSFKCKTPQVTIRAPAPVQERVQEPVPVATVAMPIAVPTAQPIAQMPQMSSDMPNSVRERDQRVLYDELYPPYRRSDAESTRMLIDSPVLRGTPTRYPSNDTYRLVGYMVDEEDRNDVWKLFAREQHRGGRAAFYASPANRNMELKVQLDDRNVTGNQFRDLYNLPSSVRLRHPMFTQGADYRVVELDNSDLASPYI